MSTPILRMCLVVLGKLTQIDDLTRSDHSYLEPNDQCYYFDEYTARQAAQHSPCNQLIRNFKHERKWAVNPTSGPWFYKQQAISRVAEAIAHRTNSNALRSITFVPIPPSKIASDAEYDSRCLDCLNQISRFAGHHVDVRELVAQAANTRKSHGSDDRLTPDELFAGYRINELVVNAPPTSIAVFDDLLTTGAHFKAMQRVFQRRFPGVPVAGIFIARRIIEIEL